MYKPVVLMILDGYGRGAENAANAIFKARKPNLDSVERNYPMTNLQASAIAAGQPWGEEGNSEVGHLNLGTGRIIYQYLPRISFAIRDGSFFKNPELLAAAEHIKKNNGAFHIFGLMGSGNVHSYFDHVFALLDFAKMENLGRTYIHPFTDGRDSPPKDALEFFKKAESRIARDYPFASIATLIGRHYGLDRDANWDRTEKTYRLLAENQGEKFESAEAAIKSDYDKGVYDEWITPKVIAKGGAAPEPVKAGDAAVFIDFREDSARQLAHAFLDEKFDKFERKKIDNLFFATMTRYEKDLPAHPLFDQLEIKNSLAEVVSASGKNQIHIAEVGKYAHVTYFFNGGTENPFPGEDRILIPSNHDRVKEPALAAPEVTQKTIKSLKSNKYDLIVVNYANADMVGHTGNFDATVSAIEALDIEVGKVMVEILEMNGVLVITADHGNADLKINLLTGEPISEHSSNPVPLYLVGKDFKREKTLEEMEIYKNEIRGILADVAPTVLELMGLSQPPEMTGKSLLKVLNLK